MTLPQRPPWPRPQLREAGLDTLGKSLAIHGGAGSEGAFLLLASSGRDPDL